MALKAYIDTILSTKLFGGSETLVQVAYKHECVKPFDQQQLPIICDDQDIRNLCYQHRESRLGGNNFLKCPDCAKQFDMNELVENVLVDCFGSTENLDQKLKLAVKRYSAQIDRLLTMAICAKQDFMIHALNNLHASSHAHSCFKKGYECRNKIPDRPCKMTMIHFDETNQIMWWTWNGTKNRRASFYAEPSRHAFAFL